MIDNVGQLIDELQKYPRNILVEVNIMVGSIEGEVPIVEIGTKKYMGRREMQEEVVLCLDL